MSAPKPKRASTPVQVKKLKDELMRMRREVTDSRQRHRQLGDEIAEDRTGLDEGDVAWSASTRELLFRASQSEGDLVRQVDEALRRMDSRGYGVCVSCGEPISARRLAAVPYATRCRDCQEKEEQGAGRA